MRCSAQRDRASRIPARNRGRVQRQRREVGGGRPGVTVSELIGRAL